MSRYRAYGSQIEISPGPTTWGSPDRPLEDGRPPELADVGKLVRRGVRAAVGAARAGERVGLGRVLTEHLGAADSGAVLEEVWPGYEHVNVQAGVEHWLGTGDRQFELVGIVGFRHRDVALADLLGSEQGHDPQGPRPGSAATVNRPCGPNGEVRACQRCAVYLVVDGAVRIALLLLGPDPDTGRSHVSVQLACTDPEVAGRVAYEIREATIANNVFRGHLLSFGGEVFGRGEALLQFHRRPVMTARQLVLDDVARRQVERQAVSVARHGARLRAAGQHVKRGLLLYGPPGVGKTHTIRYLVSLLSDVTVVQLTGTSMHLVGEACSVARTLQPAMVVIEDVDLIAEDRGHHPGQHPLLFQLLNEMDGLAEDADVLFVLTTNRADLLEAALTARPGRVDQAVELTLPDAAARRALFELYRGDLDVDTSELDDVIARTDGVTASFLKELLRRAALVAAERTPEQPTLVVAAADLGAALDELLDTRNAMTRTLLGGSAG